MQFLLVPEVAMDGTDISKEDNDIFFDIKLYIEESHINVVSSGEESDASSVGDGDHRKYRVRRNNLIG